MYGKIDYKFLDCAKRMPALYNKLPDEQYDIRKSEVISWLIKQPEIQSKIFDMAKAQKVIEYDKNTKKWKGINSAEYPENENEFSEDTKLKKTYNIETDISGKKSIGVAIYTKCIEKGLSLTEFYSLLNEYNIYIDDLRSETLNDVVVYGASKVLGMELYDLIQKDDRIFVYFFGQLINNIDSMYVSVNAEVYENEPIYILRTTSLPAASLIPTT